MWRRLSILTALLTACAGSAAAAPLADSRSVVQVTTRAEADAAGRQLRLIVQIRIDPGWHINAHTPSDEFLIPTEATFDGNPEIRISAVRYPEPVRRRLAVAERPLDIYEGLVEIVADADILGDPAQRHSRLMAGTLSLQACSDTVCLAPASLAFSIDVDAAANTLTTAATEPGTAPPEAGWWATGVPSDAVRRPSGWIDRAFSQEPSAWWFLVSLLAGLALNLTPCVFPMVPVTLAFFGGQRAGNFAYTAMLGVSYVAGLSLTFALLGTLAAQTGALLGSWLQQPAVLLVLAAMMTALALSMFGLYELRPPRWFAERFGQAQSGRAGALVMGMSMGVIASPCIGPFVLGLLVAVSRIGNPWLGFALLFTMGLGMGLPYIALGLAANRVAVLPKAGVWMVWVKRLLGVVLLGLALHFVRPLLPDQFFSWMSPGRPRGAAVVWQPYSHAALAQAARDGRPVLVDGYADWCLPCVELDHVTFRDPEVVARLSRFVTLRVDATLEVPAEAGELFERYGVYGVPTVLFFDADGTERADLRLAGFLPPGKFLERLDNVK